MMFDEYPVNIEREFILDIINLVFSVIFLLEAAIKLIGYGKRSYFESVWNQFDFFLVAIIILEIIIQPFFTADLHVLQSLRVLRLLRVFKLARFWAGLYDVLMSMKKAFKVVAYFGVIIYLFVLSFSVLGQEIFGNKLMFDDEGKPVPVY